MIFFFFFYEDIAHWSTTLPMMQLAFGSISTAAPEQQTAEGVNLCMHRFQSTQQKHIMHELNWNTGLVHRYYI